MPSDDHSDKPDEHENKYVPKGMFWLLLALILLVAAIAVVAMILPFLYSPTYPNGYVLSQITTKVSGTEIVPEDSITAFNRYLYVFNAPTTVGAATSSKLSFAGVKAGMQFLVSNNTSLPLSVTSGTTTPKSSNGNVLTTMNTQGKYNWCIPDGTSGSLGVYSTTSVIPPGSTFFFVSPSDNNLNLVQSTPINVVASGSPMTTSPCT